MTDTVVFCPNHSNAAGPKTEGFPKIIAGLNSD
jgi:hypothetical protein